MKTALEVYGHTTEESHYLIDEIRAWMRALPLAPFEIQKDGLWSCHGIARAVHQRWRLDLTGWQVRDGYFQGNYQHTWLEKMLNKREGLILDIYPVASAGGPLLIEAKSPASPWRNMYKAAPDRYAAFKERFETERQLLLAA